MDANTHGSHEHALPLAELFECHTGTPLAENTSDDCHAFQIYEARNALVRQAAYLRAQARGFEPGHELDDWLAAEHEVDGRMFAELAPVGFVG
jgi:Protein of unknown function (DUF2934)